MNKSQIGALLSSICATTLLTLPIASAKDSKSAMTEAAAEQKCQNNSCKGNSMCMGYGNPSCHGQNSCKGKGWLAAENSKECADKKGIWHGEADKPEKEKPTKKEKKAKKA